MPFVYSACSPDDDVHEEVPGNSGEMNAWIYSDGVCEGGSIDTFFAQNPNLYAEYKSHPRGRFGLQMGAETADKSAEIIVNLSQTESTFGVKSYPMEDDGLSGYAWVIYQPTNTSGVEYVSTGRRGSVFLAGLEEDPGGNPGVVNMRFDSVEMAMGVDTICVSGGFRLSP